MNISHTVSASAVERGEHVYVRQGFRNRMERQGIVVAGSDFGRCEKQLVVLAKETNNGMHPKFACVTLNEFMEPNLKLRRVLYGQGSAFLRHFKLRGTSYINKKQVPDRIVDNIKILYNNQSESLGQLIGSKFENFCHICCTTNSKHWKIPFSPQQPTDESPLSMTSPSENTTDAMPTNNNTTAERNPSDSSNKRTHHVDINDLKVGDHIYAWRKGVIYQHHGIVIAGKDISKNLQLTENRTFEPPISSNAIIEDLMVIENNNTKPNIRFVTLAEFARNDHIRLVLYGMNRKRDMFRMDTISSGQSHLEDAIDPEKIVDNARFLYYRSNGQMNEIFGGNEIKTDSYNLWNCNCEHFAFRCSTNIDLIKNCCDDIDSAQQNRRNRKQISYIEGESQQIQQIQALVNGGCRVGTIILKQLDEFFNILDFMIPKNMPAPRIVMTAVRSGTSLNKCLSIFTRTAGPMIGKLAAITFALEIIILTVRYAVYCTLKKIQKKLFLARGLAIRSFDFIKGVCKAILSNGLGACFSLLAGAIGMLIPIPFVNILISVALGSVGYMIGRYIGGVPINFLRRYYLKKKKEQKQRAIQA